MKIHRLSAWNQPGSFFCRDEKSIFITGELGLYSKLVSTWYAELLSASHNQICRLAVDDYNVDGLIPYCYREQAVIECR